MAKMLWLSMAAACLCQSCATAVHGAEVAAVHGAEGIVKAGTNLASHHLVAHATAEAHEEGVNQASVSLLGMIVFIVLLYYMVNSHIHGVKKTNLGSALNRGLYFRCSDGQQHDKSPFQSRRGASCNYG